MSSRWAPTRVNFVDDRSIPGVGFSPRLVVVFGEGAYKPLFASSTMTIGESYDFCPGDRCSNFIQALESDGFQIGTDQNVNLNSHTYHYIAWNAVPGRMAVGSYTGTGNGTNCGTSACGDNRAIDAVGFRPEWVIVRRNLNGSARTVHKPRSSGALTDVTYRFMAPVGSTHYGHHPEPATGRVLGRHRRSVNGNTQLYHWMAFGPADGNQAAGALANPTAGCGFSGARSPLDKVSQRKIVRDVNGYKYLVFAKFRETTPGSCSGYQEIKLARSTDGGRTWSEVTLFGSGGLAWNTATDSFVYPAIDTNPARTQLHVVVNYGGQMLFTKNVNLAAWNQSAYWTEDGGGRNAPYEGAEHPWLQPAGASDTAPAITVDAENRPHIAYGSATSAGQVHWTIGVGGSWNGTLVSQSTGTATQNASIDYGYGPNQSGVMEERIHVLFSEAGNTLRYSHVTKNVGGLFSTVTYSGSWSIANGANTLRGFSIVAENGKVWAVGAFDAGAGSWVTKAAYSCDNGDRFGQPGDTCGYGYNGGQTVAAGPLDRGLPERRLLPHRQPTPAPGRGAARPRAPSPATAGCRGTARSSTAPRCSPTRSPARSRTRRTRPSRRSGPTPRPSSHTAGTSRKGRWRPSSWTRSAATSSRPSTTAPSTSETRTRPLSAPSARPRARRQVTGSGGTTWQTDNWGRGDRITIDGVTYAVSTVLSNTSLVLASPFLGTTGSGKAYTIGRQFKGTKILQTWENCISGTSACPYFPVRRRASSLTTARRSASSTTRHNQHTGTLDIDGSTTDFVHSITLTVATGNRHNGCREHRCLRGLRRPRLRRGGEGHERHRRVARITARRAPARAAAPSRWTPTTRRYNGLTTIRHNLIVNTGSHGILVGTTTNRLRARPLQQRDRHRRAPTLSGPSSSRRA